MRRNKGVKVPPLSRDKIRENADIVRAIFGIQGGIKATDVLEFCIPEVMPEFVWTVEEIADMGNDHARTYPDKQYMQIRKDVYDNAAQINKYNSTQYGRDNFTIAHEIGHLVLHSNISSYARDDPKSNNRSHKIYEDSEWQADNFSAEFLMPYNEAILCSSVDEIQTKFMVSRQAAEIRMKTIRNKS